MYEQPGADGAADGPDFSANGTNGATDDPAATDDATVEGGFREVGVDR